MLVCAHIHIYDGLFLFCGTSELSAANRLFGGAKLPSIVPRVKCFKGARGKAKIADSGHELKTVHSVLKPFRVARNVQSDVLLLPVPTICVGAVDFGDVRSLNSWLVR